MPAAVTDKFSKTFNSVNPNVARVNASRAAGVTTLACDNLAGWPTDTVVHFSTYRVGTDGTVTAGTQIDWKGIVSGNNIGSLTRVAGATDSGNSINDVVEMNPTGNWGNDLVSGLLVQHNQDGSHGAVTATSLTTTGNVTIGGTLTIGGSGSGGWDAISGTISAVTYNGNRSYDLTTSNDNTALITPGMRFRTTRTVAAPTQSTSLNGTTQYYSKTSPAGMTFTDDFVVSAWVKLSSYGTTGVTVASRFNGTSGWILRIGALGAADGRVYMNGFNAGGSNYCAVTSYQSIPLNKWVHITAQLDMSSYPTVSATTSYVMIDGVDVPCSMTRAGTNPTALVQAGNFEIGSDSGGAAFFPGKIAQVAVFNAKVTQATMRGYISQGLAGTETSLISAYSFNNAITDLNTTNANNLTANGSAVATNADSPFGGQAGGTISSTLDYGIVAKVTASTITVNVAEGCTIPTSGGVASASYSTYKSPFGFPSQRGKWVLESIQRGGNINNGASTSNTYYNVGSFSLTAPVGSFQLRLKSVVQATMGAATAHGAAAAIGTAAGNTTDVGVCTAAYAASVDVRGQAYIEAFVSPTVATPYYVNLACIDQNATNLYLVGANQDNVFTAENAYL